MERTYSRSQCGGPRAAMPAVAPPGPGLKSTHAKFC